ncbi:MAG TPA: calcium/proton exchanger [Chthoniobacterales bacterium]|nr:calcium/proton exchanger [Chthoniobacterales bacterium]
MIAGAHPGGAACNPKLEAKPILTDKVSIMKPSLNWLLIFVPAALVLRFVPSLSNPTALFICSAIAIIPVAGWIGRATEELAARVGEGVGGLLNATFGNAAELIIAGVALSKGLTGVVKASITGSIIGNILLVLGLSTLLGGIRHKEQVFNKSGVRTSVVSLSLAAIALIIPTVFHMTAAASPSGWAPNVEHQLSLGIAIVLFVTYLCVLVFTLGTHKHFFIGCEGELEHDVEHWSRLKSVVVLVIATGVVALLSEFLVGTIEAVRHSLVITEVFVGVIVVAIVGNAAEHSTAIVMALKNKMDLSVGIAIGSSLQVALFVAPLLVFLSYFLGRPMNLEFSLPEIFAVVASVYIIFQISGDGETNWIEGVQLLSVYLILGILFFYLPEPHVGSEGPLP